MTKYAQKQLIIIQLIIHIMKELQEYLKEKKEELQLLKGRLSFLEQIEGIARINESSKGLLLHSDDYSLATDCVLEKKQEFGRGSSGYDGGYQEYINKIYVKLFFNIAENELGIDSKVIIWPEDYLKNEEVYIHKFSKITGWGDDSSEKGYKDISVNSTKTLNFFKEKGVKESLLKKLDE